MNDDVNNPAHYNQNGIEVIDVIETYAKDDFRLANVLKYVCRCEYKGKKLEDLKKARWYLNRVIEEMEIAEARLEDTVPWEQVKADAGLADLWSPDHCPDCVSFPQDTYVEPSPDRIAGDDPAANKVKDDYYNFDRFTIQGYCVNCDAEIPITDAVLVSFDEEDDTKLRFCSYRCYVEAQ